MSSNDIPVTMRRLLDQGVENVSCDDEKEDVVPLLRDKETSVVLALMNHQSCEVEKKVDLEEEELVSGMKNLNLVFDRVRDGGDEDRDGDRDGEDGDDEGMYDMSWLNRREDDEEEEPTKGTKIREEEENDSSFDFDDFQDCLVPGEKTSSMGTNTTRISTDDMVVQTPRKMKTKNTVMTPAQFQRRRNVLVKKYYDEFNKNVFDSKLPNCVATTTMTTIMHDVVRIPKSPHSLPVKNITNTHTRRYPSRGTRECSRVLDSRIRNSYVHQ